MGVATLKLSKLSVLWSDAVCNVKQLRSKHNEALKVENERK